MMMLYNENQQYFMITRATNLGAITSFVALRFTCKYKLETPYGKVQYIDNETGSVIVIQNTQVAIIMVNNGIAGLTFLIFLGHTYSTAATQTNKEILGSIPFDRFCCVLL